MGALETINLGADFAEAAVAAVCCLLCIRRAQKEKENRLFHVLLAGFYVCIFLCDAFVILAWLVIDYPYIIAPSDLSWVGAIMFLITADMGMADERTAFRKRAEGGHDADVIAAGGHGPDALIARKHRLAALVAPAVCTVFNAAFIAIYPEIIANYILYYIPTAILSYYALLLYLESRKTGGIQTSLRLYHMATLAWILIQLLHNLFSTLGWDYGYAVYMTVCVCLLTLATPGIYFAARKGASAL